ncbi:hypothetical protein AAHE18_13G175800 [Arachis hypogaea]
MTTSLEEASRTEEASRRHSRWRTARRAEATTEQPFAAATPTAPSMPSCDVEEKRSKEKRADPTHCLSPPAATATSTGEEFGDGMVARFVRVRFFALSGGRGWVPGDAGAFFSSLFFHFSERREEWDGDAFGEFDLRCLIFFFKG